MNKNLFIALGIFLLIIIAIGVFLLSRQITPSQPNNTIQITAKTVIAEPSKTPTQPVAATVYVTLTLNGFSPKVITVNPNTRVIWINKSGTQATINSNPHPTHTAYPPLNLGQFGKSEQLSLVFLKAGTYGYHNHFDASQAGIVIVK